MAKLLRFSERAEFIEKHKAALKLFWGDRLLDERDDLLDQLIQSEQMNLAYHSWFAYDFDLG